MNLALIENNSIEKKLYFHDLIDVQNSYFDLSILEFSCFLALI
jgi:hypothetical protein